MIDDIKPNTNAKFQNGQDSKARPVATPVSDTFRTIIRVIDSNVMPILAWFALVGLAVRGCMTFTTHMSSEIQVVVAIAVVAFLAFKLR